MVNTPHFSPCPHAIVGRQPPDPAQHLRRAVHGAPGGEQFHGPCPELVDEPTGARVEDGVLDGLERDGGGGLR